MTIKIQERLHWRRSVGFILNCDQISHIVLVFSICNFEQVNPGWEGNHIDCKSQTLLMYLQYSDNVES